MLFGDDILTLGWVWLSSFGRFWLSWHFPKMKTMTINTGWDPQHKEQQENGSKLPPLSAKVFLNCIGCSVDDNESTVGEEEAWPGLPEPRKIHMVLFLQTLTSSRPYFDIIRLHYPPALLQGPSGRRQDDVLSAASNEWNSPFIALSHLSVTPSYSFTAF